MPSCFDLNSNFESYPPFVKKLSKVRFKVVLFIYKRLQYSGFMFSKVELEMDIGREKIRIKTEWKYPHREFPSYYLLKYTLYYYSVVPENFGRGRSLDSTIVLAAPLVLISSISHSISLISLR